MKQVAKLCSLILVMVVTLCACSVSSSMSYSFDVANGDKIKVTLDTSEGHLLSKRDEKGQFTVEQGEKVIFMGMFLSKDGYDSYLAVKGKQGMTVLEDAEKDGNEYYMYEVEGQSGKENNYVMWIKASNTGIMLVSISGKDKV